MKYSTFATVGGIAQSGTFFNDEYEILFDNAGLNSTWTTAVDNAFIKGANYADGKMTKNAEYCLVETADDYVYDAATAVCGTSGGYATYIGKRNVEGGPRQDEINVDAGRFVMGLRGDLGLGDWEYDFSYLYGKTNSSSFYVNDMSAEKLVNVIEGGTAKTDYNVFEYNGVTPEMAAGVGITGSMKGTNEVEGFNFTKSDS